MSENETTHKRPKASEKKTSTRQTNSDGSSSKRRSRKVIDPGSLNSKPNIKKFIKMSGDKVSFQSSGKKGQKNVGRSSAKAVDKIYAIAIGDNKKARTICKIAVTVAAASKHATVGDDHVQTAVDILAILDE
jgi:hypothetical protein